MLAETFLERALVERDQGHLDRAEELLQQSLSLYEDVRMAAACLRELGEVARCRKDHGSAGRLIAESLATFRRLEDRPDTGRTLLVMARLAHGMGHHERAAALLKEALALWTGGMTRLERVRWLEAFAAVSPHVGAAEQGARLLGAAARARAEMGTPLPPVERGWYDRVRVSLASALGQERLETLHENGQAVTVEEAIESLRA